MIDPAYISSPIILLARSVVELEGVQPIQAVIVLLGFMSMCILHVHVFCYIFRPMLYRQTAIAGSKRPTKIFGYITAMMETFSQLASALVPAASEGGGRGGGKDGEGGSSDYMYVYT